MKKILEISYITAKSKNQKYQKWVCLEHIIKPQFQNHWYEDLSF